MTARQSNARKRVVRGMRLAKTAYARLNPYSRIVFLLKIIIPVAAVSLFAFVMIWPSVSGLKVKVNVPKLDKANDITFTVSEGRVAGQGAKGEKFEITASDFRENRKDETMFFKDLSGRLIRPDESWLDISGRDGIYNRSLQKFVLAGNVRVVDGDSMEIQTDKAEVDIDANTVEGNVPVRASTPFGFITGSAYKFVKDDTYRFLGRVEGRIDSDKLEAGKRRRK